MMGVDGKVNHSWMCVRCLTAGRIYRGGMKEGPVTGWMRGMCNGKTGITGRLSRYSGYGHGAARQRKTCE